MYLTILSHPLIFFLDQRGITAGGGPNNKARVFYLRWFVDIVVGDVVEEDRAAWLRSPTRASDGASDVRNENGVRATLLPFHHCHGGASTDATNHTTLPLGGTWSFDRDVWPTTPTVRLPPSTPRVRLTRLSIEENGKTRLYNSDISKWDTRKVTESRKSPPESGRISIVREREESI